MGEFVNLNEAIRIVRNWISIESALDLILFIASWISRCPHLLPIVLYMEREMRDKKMKKFLAASGLSEFVQSKFDKRDAAGCL